MKTIIETPGGVLAEVHRHKHMGSGHSACEVCDFSIQSALCIAGHACRDYDTPRMTAYLKRLATPTLRLNTPSEARREAAGK